MHPRWRGRHRRGRLTGRDVHHPEDGGFSSVASLAEGESATMVEVAGGGHLQARLANMGLRAGKTITKLGALPGRGPVTVKVDGCRVALGHGIAHKVLVERAGEKPNDSE